MPRGLAPADFEGGQLLFRVSAYARKVGEHPTTSWRKIKKGEIPVVETVDGLRITAGTLAQQIGPTPTSELKDKN